MNKIKKFKQFLEVLYKDDEFKGSQNIYTPLELAEEMTSKIILKNKSILVLFNVEFVADLVYNKKVKPNQITFYSDNSKKTELVRFLFGIKKVIDQLNTTMKFDVVIGNPPYDDPTNHGRKLWTLFSQTAFSLVKDNGYIIFVTPSGWIESNSSAFKKVRTRLISDFNLLICSRDAKKHFKVDGKPIGSDIGYWIAQKVSYKGITSYINNESSVIIDLRNGIPKSAEENFVLGIEKKILNSGDPRLLFEESPDFSPKKMSKQETKSHNIRCIYSSANIGYINWVPKDFGILKLVINLSSAYYTIKVADNNMPITKDATGSLVHYVPLKSVEQGKKIKSYLTSKAIRFFVNSYKKKNTGFNHAVRQRKIPLLKEKFWTDKEVYEHFKFTQKEIEYIEKHVK
jgi:hypothetical protein